MNGQLLVEMFWTLGVMIGTVAVITVLYEAWSKITNKKDH